MSSARLAFVTGHQAFFTQEALAAIAQTTLQNIADLEAGRPDPARLVKARSSPSGHCRPAYVPVLPAAVGITLAKTDLWR